MLLNNCLLETDFSSESCSFFENATGISESYLLLSSAPNASFQSSLQSLNRSLQEAYHLMNLSEETQLFTRFFFSDIRNQKEQLLNSPLYHCLKQGACSFVEQLPLGGSSLAVFVHHIRSRRQNLKKQQCLRERENSVTLSGENYELFASCDLNCTGPFTSYDQTWKIFQTYEQSLSQRKMSLQDNTVRTWLYVSDIDNQYKGMADARRDFFETRGLTKETHFFASTGIEGQTGHTGAIVSMDAVAFRNLVPEQVTQLSAPSHLNPTHEYGVTFERGTKVDFGDRTHYYISGTASIDRYGHVLHVDDIENQTFRTVENINSLLLPETRSINDMLYLLVYLRDPAHYPYVCAVLDTVVDSRIPRLYLQARVCRPSWLVEIEAFGASNSSTSFPVFI